MLKCQQLLAFYHLLEWLIHLSDFKHETSLFVFVLVFMSNWNFLLSWVEHKKVHKIGARIICFGWEIRKLIFFFKIAHSYLESWSPFQIAPEMDFYVFVLSCVCYVFVRVCLYVLCGHLLGKGWPLGSRLWCLLWVCHFPIGILGQVWYLIVSIPDLCTLAYFKNN